MNALSPAAESNSGSQYAELSRLVRQAGLLNRRRGHYASRMGVTGGLLAGAWTVFVWLGESWWQPAVAAVLAVIFTQAGFVGHDDGHRQMRDGWFIDNLLGGLNYQIEHHLFPDMPRPNLRRAQTLVRRFCMESRAWTTAKPSSRAPGSRH